MVQHRGRIVIHVIVHPSVIDITSFRIKRFAINSCGTYIKAGKEIGKQFISVEANECLTAGQQYLCSVKPLLKNPVYNSLLSNDRHLGFGTEKVRCFNEEVSPFVGFEEGYENGFSDLYQLLPSGRRILYATPLQLAPPKDWKLMAAIKGLQFLFDSDATPEQGSFHPVPLKPEHVEQMVALAALTKPGPFGLRTIEFGHYYGVFEDKQLVAMMGQRLHIENFTEVSAVCTHPDHLGKGYASALVQHQVALILRHGEIPFLHVRADNQRAIAVYERLGFTAQGEMNFYFLKK